MNVSFKGRSIELNAEPAVAYPGDDASFVEPTPATVELFLGPAKIAKKIADLPVLS